MVMNTMRKGALAEIKAIAWLIEQGYEVYRNISPEGPFDLIAIKPKETVYIDVKTVSERLDFGVASLGASSWNKSANKYPELNKKLLYVYKDQVAWKLIDLKIED